MNYKESNPKDVIGIRKIPYSTVSASVMAEVGVGMLEGCKYGRHNYRVVGVLGSVYYDAALRHLTSWWEGEDIDPDSGLNHVTKAICSLVVLRDAMIQDQLRDDRPPKAPEGHREALQEIVEQILDKGQIKSPCTQIEHGEKSIRVPKGNEVNIEKDYKEFFDGHP